MKHHGSILLLSLCLAGCATLFGWDIHAPGMLSSDFSKQIQPVPVRLALYLPPEVSAYESQDKGGRLADPQTYHVGEAFSPMALEAFQEGFEEFILMETEPSAQILKQCGIPYLAVVAITDFGNKVTLKGQAIAIQTEVVLYNQDLYPVIHFQASGLSDAEKVFAKRGGPQVNLNAAIERCLLAIVQQLQDSVLQREEKENG
ncbi:MAG: hypothetical protein JW893_00390 [Candidatus Omnitrophica bacterium]|nr:hypothetical protein [Candidatus Omnitrophota bacterium]